MIRFTKPHNSFPVPDDIRIRADRHPLTIMALAFFVLGTAATAVGAGLAVSGLLWDNTAMTVAGSLTAVGGVIFGFQANWLQGRAIHAATLETNDTN